MGFFLSTARRKIRTVYLSLILFLLSFFFSRARHLSLLSWQPQPGQSIVCSLFSTILHTRHLSFSLASFLDNVYLHFYHLDDRLYNNTLGLALGVIVDDGGKKKRRNNRR